MLQRQSRSRPFQPGLGSKAHAEGSWDGRTQSHLGSRSISCRKCFRVFRIGRFRIAHSGTRSHIASTIDFIFEFDHRSPAGCVVARSEAHAYSFTHAGGDHAPMCLWPFATRNRKHNAAACRRQGGETHEQARRERDPQRCPKSRGKHQHGCTCHHRSQYSPVFDFRFHFRKFPHKTTL